MCEISQTNNLTYQCLCILIYCLLLFTGIVFRVINYEIMEIVCDRELFCVESIVLVFNSLPLFILFFAHHRRRNMYHSGLSKPVKFQIHLNFCLILTSRNCDEVQEK